MAAGKMHDNEVATDAALVRRLLAAQFPQWAALPIAPVASAGTDNALYRLGEDMVVRLPRIPGATGQIDKEQRWLPQLAPHLPLEIPLPLAKGDPDEGYPWNWSVYQWLEGENATAERIADMTEAAKDLAHFIAALQNVDASEGPSPSEANSGRGVPLATRASATRKCIAELDELGMIDAPAALAAWEAALDVPAWERPPRWIHGDLQSGNILAQHGKLSAVIDYGCLAVGDPACDLQVAWNLFSGESRAAFRAALNVDEATWARGRGWALSVAVIALPYYHRTNPVLADIARHAIREVLAEHDAT